MLILRGFSLRLLGIASLVLLHVLLRMRVCHNQLKVKMDLCNLSDMNGKNFFVILLALLIYNWLIFLPPVICSSPRVHWGNRLEYLRVSEQLLTSKRVFGGILHLKNLRTLKIKRAICYPFSFLLYNTKPVGHQVLEMLVL